MILKQEADRGGGRSQGASVDHIPGRKDGRAMASGDASTACRDRAARGQGVGRDEAGELGRGQMTQSFAGCFKI